jgi:hypothetical protein
MQATEPRAARTREVTMLTFNNLPDARAHARVYLLAYHMVRVIDSTGRTVYVPPA